jgi:hypothetical protein
VAKPRLRIARLRKAYVAGRIPDLPHLMAVEARRSLRRRPRLGVRRVLPRSGCSYPTAERLKTIAQAF